MAVLPAFPPKWRAFDANGEPLSGGLLYTYEAGTSTPLATYTTRAGNIANANPVVLDANGEADVWVTPGVLYKFELHDASDVLQWTVDNVPSADEATDTTTDVVSDPGGRLTLATATPVTTTAQTGKTTVYYVPHKHNKVPLWDGESWALHSVATELSQATSDNTKSPAAVTTNSNYDVFIWDDDGTLRLSRGPAWSSDTARGTGAGTTELERVDGRWTNKVSISNGPAANLGLYVGTVRSDASSQINDYDGKRHVWNTYNRVARHMLALDSTDTWNYTTATFRQANANTANQLDVVIGLNEEIVEATVLALGSNTTEGVKLSVGIGVDSTTVNSAKLAGTVAVGTIAGTIQLTSTYSDYVGIGRHTLVWLEYSEATGTSAFYGDAGAPSRFQSGIIGRVMA